MAGTITYTNRNAVGANKAFVSGSITCDGAATNVEVGFQPSKIVLTNLTDDSMFYWVAGMDAGTFMQQVTGGTFSEVATGGPVVFAGDSDEGEGFTLPATAVFNTADDVVVFEAWR